MERIIVRRHPVWRSWVVVHNWQTIAVMTTYPDAIRYATAYARKTHT